MGVGGAVYAGPYSGCMEVPAGMQAGMEKGGS